MSKRRTIFVTGATGDERQWALALQAVASFRRHTAHFADMALVSTSFIPQTRYLGPLERALKGTVGIVQDAELGERCVASFARSQSQHQYPPIVMAKWHIRRCPQFAGYDRIVWFDTDMTAVVDLEGLAEIENPTGLAAVQDILIPTWAEVENRYVQYGLYGPVGIKPRSAIYYNVGLMVIDPANLPADADKTFDDFDRTADAANWFFRDQDTLNAAFDFSTLDTRWNRDYRKYGADGGPGAAVVHYPGIKPTLLFERAYREICGG